MKTVILSGGRGTRLDKYGSEKPKGLFKIGDEPVIWHICKLYSLYGIRDFIFSLGFLANEFAAYVQQPLIRTDQITKGNKDTGPFADRNGWNIDLVDTGADTNTGGRIKLLEPLLNDADFCVTYGDGLADVNISALIDFHKAHGKIATLTAVNPISPFGLLEIDGNSAVVRFREKPVLDSWINGGFFVFKREIFDYLKNEPVLEREPFERLSNNGELMAFEHKGFWKCMDTYKDNLEFNELWASGAPWKIW